MSERLRRIAREAGFLVGDALMWLVPKTMARFYAWVDEEEKRK